MANCPEFIGQRSGLLTVIGTRRERGKGNVLVLRCDCGSERTTSRWYWLQGTVKSCGCGRARHGHARKGQATSEYGTWRMMRRRCEDPLNLYWERYGGRGIRVCERWRESFDAFLEDMGEKPSPRHSIDRINGDGDYEPGNCRWATPAEQSRNLSSNRRITFQGRTMCLMDWATECGLTYDALSHRLRAGWSVEKALTTAVGAVLGRPTHSGVRDPDQLALL